MPNKVNIVRPDGTVLSASPEQANRLKLLGYKEEAPEEEYNRDVETGRENYYSSTGEQIKTAGEGALSGLTLGASDYLFGDDDTKARAKYNPGIRMGAEALGSLLPLVLSDGGTAAGLGEEAASGLNEASFASKAAEYTPTNLLSRGAEKLAGVVGTEGTISHSALKGAIEGAGFGAAEKVDHAYLDGDPLTAEAVLHGIGWGAIFGGGLGAIGGAVERVGVAAKEAERASVAAKEATEAAELATRTTQKAGDLLESGRNAWGGVMNEVTTLSKSLDLNLKHADAVMSTSFKKMAQLESNFPITAEMAVERNAIQRAYKQAERSVRPKAMKKPGGADRAAEKVAIYQKLVDQAGAKLGLTTKVGNAGAGLMEITQVRVLQKELKSFPKTIEEFAAMTPKRSNDFFASLDKATGLKNFPELADSVKASIDGLTTSLGAEAGGVDGLRKAFNTLKEAKATMSRGGTKLAAKAGEEETEGPGVLRRLAGVGAGAVAARTARKMGGGWIMSGMAYKAAKGIIAGPTLAGELMGARNAVISRLRNAAANYAPKLSRSINIIAPRAEPLAVKLNGTLDNSSKDRQALALARVKEVQQTTPVIKDTLYRSIEPIAIHQPTLGPALHSAGIEAFKALLDMMPKDPGAVSGLKSLWNPDVTQTEVLSRQFAVFHDPVGQVEDMVQSGQFDPIKIDALKNIAPAVYQELRLAMIDRVTDPKIMDKMSYQDQIGMSTMLDIAIHSSMEPGYIAAAQQIFTDRNQPNKTPMNIGQQSQGSNGGRPSDSDIASPSQKITEH